MKKIKYLLCVLMIVFISCTPTVSTNNEMSGDNPTGDNPTGNTKIPVSKVLMSSSEINLIIGEQTLIIATVQPDNATNKSITWSSSDDTIATVTNGTITAVSKGTAIIRATADDVNGATTVNVIVPITGIQNSETEITCPVGTQYKIKASLIPSNANYKTINWNTSNSSIATVSNGLITALSEGTVNIMLASGEFNHYESGENRQF